MFCKNCGKELNDGVKFCTGCGAEIAQVPENAAEDFVLSSPKKAPAKKKGGKKWFFGVVAAVVVVAVVLVALNWNAIFNNSAKLSGPEHLAKVETIAKKQMVDSFVSGYSMVLSNSSATSQASMSLQLGDEILELLEQTISQSGTSMDLDWLSDAEVSMDVASKGSMMQIMMGLKLSGTKLLDVDAIYDMEKQNILLGLPELSDEYLEVSAGNTSVITSVSQEDILNILPSAENMEILLNRYLDIILAGMEDVEKEVDTVELDGLEQECYVLTVELSAEELYDILLEILEAAEDDKELEAVFDDYSDYCNEVLYAQYSGYQVDLHEDFLEAVWNAQESLESSKEYLDNEDCLQMTVYADKKDQIIGREIEIVADDEPVGKLSYLTVTEGNAYAFEGFVEDRSGNKLVEIEGEGTNKKNVIDGQYTLTAAGQDILELELIGVDQSKASEGIVKGTYRIEPTSELLEQVMGSGAMFADLALELTFDISNDKSDMDINILANDTLLFKVALSGQTGSQEIKVPSGDTVDVNNQQALMKWLAGLDLDKVIDAMKQAGVPEEYVDLAEYYANQLASMRNQY